MTIMKYFVLLNKARKCLPAVLRVREIYRASPANQGLLSDFSSSSLSWLHSLLQQPTLELPLQCLRPPAVQWGSLESCPTCLLTVTARLCDTGLATSRVDSSGLKLCVCQKLCRYQATFKHSSNSYVRIRYSKTILISARPIICGVHIYMIICGSSSFLTSKYAISCPLFDIISIDIVHRNKQPCFTL